MLGTLDAQKLGGVDAKGNKQLKNNKFYFLTFSKTQASEKSVPGTFSGSKIK